MFWARDSREDRGQAGGRRRAAAVERGNDAVSQREVGGVSLPCLLLLLLLLYYQVLSTAVKYKSQLIELEIDRLSEVGLFDHGPRHA